MSARRWNKLALRLKPHPGFVLACCAASMVVVLALSLFQPAFFGEERLLRPYFFRARQVLKREPNLASDLVIFALGDSSVSALQATDLSLEEWGKIFVALQKQGARDIFIDKLFSFSGTAEQNSRFLAELARLKRAPVTGAFYSTREISGRSQLEVDDPALLLKAGAASDPIYSPFPLYGAAPEFRAKLSRPGLINFERGTVPLLIRKGPDSGLPFATARLAKTEQVIPEISEGKVLVNFLSPQALAKSKLSLQALREAVQAKQAIPGLEPGATVLLLTAYYTGGTQPIETPFGEQPSGAAHIALANSVLTGQWVRPVANPLTSVLLATLLSAGLAALAPLSAALAGGVVFVAILSALAVSLFALQSTLFPLSLCLVGFALAFLPIVTRRAWLQRKEYQLISNSLEGLVPQAELRSLLRTGARRVREPHNYHLSVMFIDLVGFSELAEASTPKQSFSLLKEMLTEITQLVHQQGGIIDKTLGDGLLCFFGISADGSLQTDHADRAVHCALAIQKQSVTKTLAAAEGQPILPLRIGINSGNVVMGDLGSFNRVDLTVIGANVNLAKRFESACEPFGVVVGETTMQQLAAEDLIGAKPPQRWFPIKHYADPVKAFEFKPVLEKGSWDAAVARFRTFKKLSRKDTRHFPATKLAVDCGWFGEGELVNFSSSGLCVSLPRYLGPGIHLRCELKFEGETVAVLGEVRWGSVGTDSTYLHGLKILGLAEEQRMALFRKLEAACLSPQRNVKAIRPKTKSPSKKRA